METRYRQNFSNYLPVPMYMIVNLCALVSAQEIRVLVTIKSEIKNLLFSAAVRSGGAARFSYEVSSMFIRTTLRDSLRLIHP